MIDIYYGLWSAMSTWKISYRSAVVIGVICLLIYIIFPIVKWILKMFLKCLDRLLKLIYLGISFLLELGMRKQTPQFKIESMNNLTNKVKGISKAILSKADNLRYKRFSFVKLVIVYIILVLIIALPDLLKDIIHPQYIDILSKGADFYHSLEENVLKTAGKYPPLFQ